MCQFLRNWYWDQFYLVSSSMTSRREVPRFADDTKFVWVMKCYTKSKEGLHKTE